VILSENLLKSFEFKVIQDGLTIFSNLELYENNNSQEEKKDMYSQNSSKHMVFKNLNEMSRITDKFIEEQKKFINFYKHKKVMKKAEDFDIINKKKDSNLNNFDKLEISILTKNLKNLTDHFKTINNTSLIQNSFALNNSK